MTTEAKKETVRFIFVGRAFSRKGETGKLSHVYVRESDFDGTIESIEMHSLWWSKPMGSSTRSVDVIGGIYEGEITNKADGGMTAYNLGRWRFCGSIEQHSLRVQLNAQDTAQEAEYAAFQATKKAKAEDPMYEALAPIREAIRRTNHAGRRAIIAKVLMHLGI